ncbi:uncharacterized protein SETTUDRAFT_152336 [Exserohilum turcica Et28A]|uniref:NADP-dependent oxidoreductase domain-containing protein n=1 Tax=Exserohilum turcicum (strain 28A) TaxID=671987 RepID=R0KQ96_EXST2|nr:uncharacterized protein SETTUDRAFT_152336 [Exserohilum turcica Et28A]EOA91189.1 hypothetical protein SETTUDRAFT_152336 [Exserohilum turcica Et28A]
MPLPTHFILNTGELIPAVGFGTWQAKPGEVERAVETALKAGYRHIDCAAIYRNEAEVGEGIPNNEDVQSALEKLLQDLGVGYLDLFLMHWPVYAVEKLHSTGKVRAIGVFNFTTKRLEDLLFKIDAVPAVNQVEAYFYLQQPALFDFCKSKGILIEAYSPLGNNQTGEPRTVDDELVGVLGCRPGMDGNQLLTSWGIQRGTVVLPKSITPNRIKSNVQVKELPKDAFEELNALERHKRFNTQSRWGFDIFDDVREEKIKKLHKALLKKIG